MSNRRKLYKPSEPKVLAGAVSTDFTYDPPAKYAGKRNAHGQLVGRRISVATPLGSELAKLRVMYQAAAEAKSRTDRQAVLEFGDAARRITEISQNVPVDPQAHAREAYRAQRVKVIRKRISDIIEGAVNTYGRPPTTIGIPSETIDEVREACCDFDVTFVVEDPQPRSA